MSSPTPASHSHVAARSTFRRFIMLSVVVLCGVLIWSGPSSVDHNRIARADENLDTAELSTPENDNPKGAATPAKSRDLIASLTIFALAIFVGFEIITKVPPTLHTPLMSGSNAISGITLVGALIVAGKGLGGSSLIGLLAVILATINVVGGFLVTHRMLAMFKRR